MRFFKPNYEYIEFLHSIDKNIILSKNLFGIVLRVHEHIYFLPVDSPTYSDYDENHHLRKTTPTILRMFDSKNQNYIGKCLFSNMFPIPYRDLNALDIYQIDKDHIALNEKKLEYLKYNIVRVNKAAQRLYKQKIRGYNQAYLLATVDFKKLEEVAIEWEIKHYKKHYNRFPDSQFFLTNPFHDGMCEYYLMNKNCKVARVLFDNQYQKIVEIKEKLHVDYAPLECFSNGELTADAMTCWFRGRGIPSWRDGLDDFLNNLGIKNKDVLLNKAFGLSLSDQYWLNPLKMPMEWKDINFFNHDFNSHHYREAVFENKIQDTKMLNLFTPNNTSDGMLKKVWIVENKKRYLLKGSYKDKGLEPFNEVLASMICEQLDLEHVEYSIKKIDHVIVSKCECFIDETTELLSAYAILKYYNVDMKSPAIDVYQQYVKILQQHGLSHITVELTKMFLLDYIIANTDRHLGNFGVIRNVKTLVWERVAPNFDSGQALNSQKEIYEMNFNRVYGCFFNKKDIELDEVFDMIKDNINFKIDFDGLYEICKKWEQLLHRYQPYSSLTFDKMDFLVSGLKTRIEKLKHRIEDL